METRSRSSSTKKPKRGSSASSGPTTSRLDLLPEILHLICGRLSTEDIARASLSCKSWALHWRAGITTAKLVVCQPLDNKVRRAPATESLAKHSPALTELQLLLCGRSSYGPAAAVVGQVSSLKNLQHLTMDFVVSETPKKGSWPMFFSDSLQLGRTPGLTIRGSGMPPIAITNLLDRLGSTNSKQHLKQLHLLMGQTNPTSQLPTYSPPVWMRLITPTAIQASTVTGDQMEQLARLTGLQELVFAPDGGVLGSHWKMLSKLKALTNLQVNGAVSYTVLQKFAALKKLRKLTVSVKLFGPSHGDLREACFQMKHVGDVSMGLVAAEGPLPAVVLHQEIQDLASSLSSNLQGLTISGFTWSYKTAECLAMLTSLTSLQLLQVQQAPLPSANDSFMDLTPLSRLQSMKKFTLHCSWAPSFGDLLRVRFGLCDGEGQQQQQGRSSIGRRNSRRISQQQQQQQTQQQQQDPHTKVTDISGLFKAWPSLQQLRLCGLTQASVQQTIWDLRGLQELKSLCLQFVGKDLAPLQTSTLPKQLEDLQLAKCFVRTSNSQQFVECLTSLSLHDCTVLDYTLITTDSTVSWTSSLATLLQSLPMLQQLELINLNYLDNQLLCQAVSDLTSLETLSIIGIGNQKLNHGALLGLTGLRKLRQLRWHVGDVLDMLPDPSSLAKLKSLVALYLHNALHTQMERWGAYAVLDSLPFCDVHVEAV